MNKSVFYKGLGLVLLMVNLSFIGFAQQKDVLMTIGNEQITKQEFETIYKKNNTKQSAPLTKEALDEYLDLFVNFKLKVKEAQSLGMDTAEKFISELAGYRKQLAQPYLTDKEVTDKLVMEAYERSKLEVRASHILINCPSDASAKDTLIAFNKALSLLKRAEKGENFGVLAEKNSDDPSAKENKGDLGYFSAFTMVYPFEDAAFKTAKGKISNPIRTRFGYHIIKTTDIRPAQGEIKVAHLMIKSPKGESAEDSLKAKAKIDELYAKIKKGESFDELTKQYSEDKNSAPNAGILQPFTTGRMVPEFENAAFALEKDGDLSAPVKTAYGWHIVKRIEKKTTPIFEEMKGELKGKVGKDSRSELNKVSFINRMKNDYKFSQDMKAVDRMSSLLDSGIYKGTWDAKKSDNMNQRVFTLDNKIYTQADFGKYIANNQSRGLKGDYANVTSALYKQYVDETIMSYEENRLDSKYAEFRNLMQEYRDGIMLFELTDEMVWSKAVKDSAGLATYFTQNREKYTWGPRIDAIVYTTANETIATDVRKLLKNKKIGQDSLLTIINKSNPLNLTIKEEKFEKGDNETVDKVTVKKGLSPNMTINNSVVFVNVKKRIEAQQKELSEARGSVISDYQTVLEKNWIKSLREKYLYTVNKEVLYSLVP